MGGVEIAGLKAQSRPFEADPAKPAGIVRQPGISLRLSKELQFSVELVRGQEGIRQEERPADPPEIAKLTPDLILATNSGLT